jgi:hypothetical protein
VISGNDYCESLEEVGQPKECAIRWLIEKIGARYLVSAVFGARSAIIYVTPESHLDILGYIPDSPGLNYSRRIGQIIDHGQKDIEQRVQFHLDFTGQVSSA